MKGNGKYDFGLMFLRLGVGLIFLYAGSQKMFGVLGGPGYVGTVEGFTKQGFMPVFAHLAIVAEFFGGLGVLLGCFTPVAAFGIACTMGTALYVTIQRVGGPAALFKPGTDTSLVFLNFALLCMAIAIMIMGAGRFSIDNRYFQFGGGNGGRSSGRGKRR